MGNRTAIVTGGSRGIGKQIALKLADNGINVVFNYASNVEKAEETLKELQSKGIKAAAVKCDVSNIDEVKQMVDKVHKEFGSIDILVNNAGITKDNLILRMNEEDFNKVIKVNLNGTFNFIKHAGRVMLKQRSGKIVNISSVVGIMGNAGQINYAAAKAGIIGITKTTAKEFASRGITVNAVAPGFIQTKMTEVLNDKVKEEILNSIPLKRFGKVEDVADLVYFLCSDQSSYITGQVINVDGGMI